MPTQVTMPQLGESVVEGTVGRWLVAEGQPVKQYDPLVQITTDKVDTEITAPASGVLLQILVPEGQTVERGTLLAVIGEPGEVPQAGAGQPPAGGAAEHGPGRAPAGAEPLEHEFPVQPPAAAEPVAPVVAPNATPVAQRMALEHGLDLAEVKGTGQGGRITKEDVEEHLGERGAAGDRETAAPQPERAPQPAPAGPGVGTAPAGHSLGFISPAVARLAAEYGVDLARITGTGEGGRVSKKDVMAYIARSQAPERIAPEAEAAPEQPAWERPGTGSLFKPTEEMGRPEQASAAPPAPADIRPAARPQPAAQPAPAGAAPATAPSSPPAGTPPAKPAPAAPAPGADDQVLPLNAMRRSIARHMVLSKQTSAHVTTVMEADMTRVVQARERLKGEYARQGAHLTFTPFFLQAIVAGLGAVPEANSTFAEENLLVHRRIHIGVAVALPDGLIVPVVRDADEKSLVGLARAVNDLAERARAKHLSPDDVQGGTFTLTNHGTAGSLLATPIINQPQAGILGVGAIQKRAVVITRSASLLPGPDDFIAIRPMVYLSFSFDHRILDGSGADRFLAAVKDYLEAYSA